MARRPASPPPADGDRAQGDPAAQRERAWPAAVFDAGCTLCPRLAAHLDAMRAAHPGYYNLPVPPFGDPAARVVIVGLAPGAHGANRTGRPFTGDFAGVLLYETLFAAGLATRPVSIAADDGLELRNCRITNAVKCLPPANKPGTAEADTCNRYLEAEFTLLPRPRVILALGAIAHRAALRALGAKPGGYRFAHGAVHRVPDAPIVVDSYHCSRYNTQTRRLTAQMFADVLATARALAT
jgi:uracil-DNA glycosylase family 4